MNEFDALLDDVLQSVANPELPERVGVHVRTRVWVQTAAHPTTQGREVRHPAAVFAPEAFLARMQPKRDARSTAVALLAHAAAIALVLWISAAKLHVLAPKNAAEVTQVSVPPPMPVAKSLMGGGGGQRGATPVTKGRLPKFAEQQITPPKPLPLDQPKIPMPEPTVEVQKDLKMANSTLPNFGMPDATVIGSSMGNGSGTGIGSGHGSGVGAGFGGNYGGGLRTIGGGVSMPVLTHKVDPEFSDEARRSKAMGVVTVTIIVDTNGIPREVRVLRGAGMGLDERAVAAVQQWRFKPAMENGRPVPVRMNVIVNFQIE